MLIGGNSNKYIESKKTFNGDYVVESRVNDITAAPNGFASVGFFDSLTSAFGLLDHGGNTYYDYFNANWYNFSFAGLGQWSKGLVKTVGAARAFSMTGETSGSFSSTAGGPTMSNYKVRLGARYDTYNADQDFSSQWDWVIVRKAVVNDPTTSLSGTEEKTEGPLVYWKFDEGFGVSAKNSIWKKTGTTTNLILNPSFEHSTATSNWTVNATNFTSTGSIEQKLFGAVSIKSVQAANNSDNWTIYSSNTLNAGTYTASAYVYIPSGGSTASVCIHDQSFTNAGGCADMTKRDQWQRITNTFTIASTIAGLIVVRGGAMATNDYFYQDGFQLEQTPVANIYCDGSVNDGNGAHAWNAAVSASTSVCDIGTDAAVNGAKWASEDQCVSGKCLKFSPTTNDGVDVSNSNSLDGSITNGLTLSAWIRPMSLAGGSTNYNIISKELYSTKQGFRLILSGYAGSNRLIMGVGDGTNISEPQSVDIPDVGKWHHVVGVFSPGLVKFYIDGKYISQSVVPVNSIVNSPASYPLKIGRYSGGTESFDGFIDEPKIYNYARSDAQIAAEYNALASNEGLNSSFGGASMKWLSEGLISHWKMNEISWSGNVGEIKDSSGNGNNATAMGGATKANTTTGKFGNGSVLDGVDDYITYADASNSIGSDYSFGAWINPTSYKSAAFPEDIAVILQKGGFYLSLNPGGTITFNYFDATTGWTGVVGAGNAPLNQWTNVYATYHEYSATYATLTLYVNGKNVGTYDKPVMPTLARSGAVVIGSESGTNRHFAGRIDEFRIYNRLLNSSEVSKLYAYAPGPVGYWNFDENNGIMINDISGNGNSAKTTNNPLWTNGKLGSALSFPTTVNALAEVYAGNSNSIDFSNTTNFTVGAWVKRVTKGSGVHTIAVKGSLALDKYWHFSISDATGIVSIQMKDGTVGPNYSNPTKTVAADNNWHYVAAVVDHDANKATVYVDGIPGSQENFGGSVNNLPANISVPLYPLRLGNWTELTNYGFAGYLDDVKIYNYARTPEQLMQDMGGLAPNTNAQSSKETMGYWKFDEKSGTTANDSSGNGKNLTIFNSPTWGDGKFGAALDYNGSTQYAKLTADTSFNRVDGQELSVSTWIYPKINGGAYQEIVMKGDNVIGFNWLLYQHTTDGSIQLHGTAQNKSTFIPTLNQWTHIVATVDSSGMYRLYANGVLVQGPIAYYYQPTAPTEMYFGSYLGGSQFYQGKIDETKIFNYALSAADIATEYNQGAAVKMSGTGTLTAGGVTDSAGAEYCVPGDTTSCNPPLGEWKFDENKGNSVADSSGNGNNGTWNTSNATHWTDGKISGAGKFKYTTSAQMTIDPSTGLPNDYSAANDSVISERVSTPITADPTSFTVSAWAKIDTNNGVWETVFSKFMNTPYRGFYLRHTANATFISACVWNNGVSACTTGNIDFGKWTHWTMNFNGSTLTLYKNGVSVGSVAGTMQAVGTTPFVIGANYGAASSSEHWAGLIDQVRYYDYLRTPAQIAYDYNRGGPVGWWKMDECQGNTINDASGQGNNGTLNVGATGTQTTLGTCSAAGSAWGNGANGKFGSSLNFDGTDDGIVIPHSSSLEVGQPGLTVAAWVKINTLPVGSHTVIGKNGPYILWLENNGTTKQIRSYLYKGAAWYGAYSSSDSITLGTWQHVAFTYDGTNRKHYINGVQSGTTDTQISGNLDALGSLLTIGYDASTRYFDGQIDDVRVYNYPLTKEQIANVVNENSALRFGPVTGSAP
jgi:hypothetical protein